MWRLRYRFLQAAIARLNRKLRRKLTVSQRWELSHEGESWRDDDLFRVCSFPNVRELGDLTLISYHEILARRHGQFRIPTEYERLRQQYGHALRTVESEIVRRELLFWLFWMAVICLASAAVGGLIYFILWLIG